MSLVHGLLAHFMLKFQKDFETILSLYGINCFKYFLIYIFWDKTYQKVSSETILLHILESYIDRKQNQTQKDIYQQIYHTFLES